ncbi:MAG: hypothetical protein ACOCZQ_02775 [Nanoarchaeota archaeon]
MQEIEQNQINYFNTRNTIEDYVRDFRLEMDNLICAGKSCPYPLPGDFKDDNLLDNFLSIYGQLTDEFLAHRFLGKDKESYIGTLRGFLGKQLPPTSLSEQYSEALDEVIEKKIFDKSYQHFTATKGKKKLKQKKGNLKQGQFLKLYNQWSSKGRKMHNYVKTNVNQIYENIFRYQCLLYSEHVGKSRDFYFGGAAKLIESTVEKLIYSSKDLIEILDIEEKFNRKSSLIKEQVDPNRFFKSRDYYESDKQTVNKINDFTLKTGTAIENLFEFVREYLYIRKPKENKGDYSKLVNLIHEIEKGNFTSPKKSGDYEDPVIYGKALQEILPKHLKNAFSHNELYKEFKMLRNACVHSTIFREYDDLTFRNGIKFMHKEGSEVKMTPVVSYLQTMHKELSQYILETVKILVMPEKASAGFIPVAKNTKTTSTYAKDEIEFRKTLKYYQINMPYNSGKIETFLDVSVGCK